MTVHAQNKSYTCGPASLRNMVRVMNKVNTGSYSAMSEAKMEDLLNTTSNGTWIEDIVTALNNKWSHYGSWKTANPVDKYDYLASVKVDLYDYKQPLIQGVRTDHLAYYNGVALNHFNTVSGYKKVDNGKKVRIMDSWNPVKIYGYLPSRYNGENPYGHHIDWLSHVFTANDVSGNGLRRLIV